MLLTFFLISPSLSLRPARWFLHSNSYPGNRLQMFYTNMVCFYEELGTRKSHFLKNYVGCWTGLNSAASKDKSIKVGLTGTRVGKEQNPPSNLAAV